jgi:hypothetical protein
MTDTAGSTTVWISPSATSFACLCEACLETARTSGATFADALHAARVRGEVSIDSPRALAHCASGHEIVLVRMERPPGLPARDTRQLQLA